MQSHFSLITTLKLETIYFYGCWLAFLALLSQIYIPLWPVPITGQTLAFLLLGLYHTPRVAFILSIEYIALGLCGLPVFHHLMGGLGVLTSPTFGYILGFPLIAVSFATIKPYIKGLWSFYILSFICILQALVLGLLYLTAILGWHSSALWSGFTLFIPGELLKISIVYVLYKNIK